MTEFKNETFVYLQQENPRVELHAYKWPFLSRLITAVGILTGGEVTIKQPRILEFPNWKSQLDPHVQRELRRIKD